MCGEVLIPCRPMQTTLRELTPKQRAFADALLEGLAPSEAYRRAYPAKGSPKVVSVKAAEVKRHPAVQFYMRKQQAKLDQKKGMFRDEKRATLAAIARDPNATTAERIKAIVVDNQMSGHASPVRVEKFGLSELLTMVRQRSKQSVQQS